MDYNHHARVRDQAAEVWGEMHQPDITEDMRFIVPWGCQLEDLVGERVLGIPVLSGPPHGNTELGLACNDAALVIAWDKEARHRDWGLAHP